MASIMPFAVEPLGFGRTIMEPSEFVPEHAIRRPGGLYRAGAASASDLDVAVENWRTSGGDRMREYYSEIFDSLEDAE